MAERETSIFYRTYSGENKAPRPDWYSKELCLKSMLISYDLLKQQVPASFTLTFDGELNAHDEWAKTLKRMIEPRGLIVERPHRGNCETTMNTIYQASERPGSQMVVIAEDDYLWLAPSLVGLYHSLTELPTHYSTPYDHPVRYQPEYPLGADYPHLHNTIYVTAERHWRTQESTCMTFASTSRTLQEDLEYFEKYKDNGKGKPEDRELFREMQGLEDYQYKHPDTPRILVGPMPSLATHAHLPWLAPLIDWETEARKVNNIKLK